MLSNSPIVIYKINLTKRIVATLIDYTILSIPIYLYMIYFGTDNNEGGKTINGIMVLPIPVFWLIYFVLSETFYGATICHHGLNLKVMTIDRKEINFTQAFKRRLLDVIDIFIYGIPALIAIKNSEKHQRLGDMWAKTIVVDTKDPQQQ